MSDLEDLTNQFFDRQRRAEQVIVDSITIPRNMDDESEDLSDEELESRADELECLEADRGQDGE